MQFLGFMVPLKKIPSCVQTHLLGSIGEKLAQIRNFTFLKIIFLTGQFTVFPAIFGLFYTIKFF